MAPEIKAAIPLDPYVVRVTFSDGEVRDVDIEPLLSGPVFGPLRDFAMFSRVTRLTVPIIAFFGTFQVVSALHGNR